jgi:hypothetical protein
VTCAGCGAANREGAAWCGQCHTALATPTTVSAPALGRPVARREELATRPTYSRWRTSATTFGPVGRVAWTLAVLLVMAMAAFSQNPFAIGPLCFIAAPLVLRSVWAKGRVT